MSAKRLIIILLISFAGILTTYRSRSNTNTSDESIESEVFACKKNKDIERVIIEAINIGAPTYNSGNHLGCYRIYEGAAYKILFEYGNKCKDIKKQLKEAVEKSHGEYTDTDRAWIMRMAFDKILGEPTQMQAPPPVKTNSL